MMTAHLQMPLDQTTIKTSEIKVRAVIWTESGLDREKLMNQDQEVFQTKNIDRN